MKNLFLFFIVLVFTGNSSVAFGAKANCPCGDWLGILPAGPAGMRLVLHISNENDSLRVIMDSPDQRVKDVAARKVEFADKKIKVSFGFGTFDGVLMNDSTIEGIWKQGKDLPLLMHRVRSLEMPQTPVAPFPYTSEDLTFSDSSTHLTYGATITFPTDNKKHPAILLISGSGQQDRNEDILGHKPFFVIADYLTRQGFVVLRVDDRGVGQTTGGLGLKAATTLDFAKDANAEFEYLKMRKEVDPKNIGLLGHSEGGMIATMLAARRNDVAYIVSLAGPGIPIKKGQIEQNEALLRQQGISEEAIKAYLSLYSKILDSAMAHDNVTDMTAAIERVVSSWRSVTPDSIVLATTEIKDDATFKQFCKGFAGQLSLPWYRYFLSYDPQPDIRSLKCKALILNGEKDIQVVAKSNLDGWRTSLDKSKSRSFLIKELPGLNHLFQECKTCGVDEYGKLEQTISPVALRILSEWLMKEIN